MNLAGVIIGFLLILILNKRINMGLSLLIGSIVAGLVSGLHPVEIMNVIFNGIVDPISLQLLIVVTLVSGLGFVLKQSGDLDKIINSLIIIFKDAKVLSTLIPMLIGTLAVPGGAIMSAPMIDESGDRINLDNNKKTAVNLFFRHIFVFIYPISNSFILTSNLFEVDNLFIIKYNFSIMLAGGIVAYFILFRGSDREERGIKEDRESIIKGISGFFSSFLPILIIIILGIIFNLPFSFAVMVGLIVALAKNLPSEGRIKAYINRCKELVTEGLKYKISVLIIGVMVFKGVVEATGAVDTLASLLSASQIPLSLMILILGMLTGYLSGLTIAALGILIPIFKPLIPLNAMGPYMSLLFTAVFIGYLISPIHLCLALTKEYFKVDFKPVYKLIALPLVVMIMVALLQTFV